MVEHLQPLLDMPRDLRAFIQAGEKLSKAQVPSSVRDAIRLGRMTALEKPNGGVRGIIVRDIVRLLVARTMPADDGGGAISHNTNVNKRWL